MDVWIARDLRDQLIRAAAAFPHEEICGLLFGDQDRVAAFACTANVALNSDLEFEIDPKALIDAHKAARAGRARVIGYFHSHPNGLCQPSAKDLETAAGDGMLWLIIAGGKIGAWKSAAPEQLMPVNLRD